MEEYELTLKLIEQINSVNLTEAFISIELNKVKELIELLSSSGVKVVPVEWNYPESIYIGNGNPSSKLQVLSLKW